MGRKNGIKEEKGEGGIFLQKSCCCWSNKVRTQRPCLQKKTNFHQLFLCLIWAKPLLQQLSDTFKCRQIDARKKVLFWFFAAYKQFFLAENHCCSNLATRFRIQTDSRNRKLASCYQKYFRGNRVTEAGNKPMLLGLSLSGKRGKGKKGVNNRRRKSKKFTQKNISPLVATHYALTHIRDLISFFIFLKW